MQYAFQNDILKLSDIREQMEMKKKKELLENHSYSVWQGKNGLWYTKLPDEEKGTVLRKRKTKDEIEKVIVEFYKEREKDPTLKSVFYQWIEEKYSLHEIEKGTYDRYECDYKRFIEGTGLEKKKIRLISEDELEYFIRHEISEKKLTSKGFSNLRTIINGTFKYAKKKKFTDISITHFFGDLDLSKKAFTRKHKEKNEQVFFEDETKIITEYLSKNPTIENLGILLAFETGVRVGELASLKPEDIDGKFIHIRRTEIKYKDPETQKQVRKVRDFPKTDAGYRTIVITDKAVETIRRIRLMNPFGEYLLEKNGKRILTASYGWWLYKACDQVGIKRRSMHKIRKTYGTSLIDAMVDESLITEQMGHSDIKCTKQYYYYSNKDLAKKQAQIEKAISV